MSKDPGFMAKLNGAQRQQALALGDRLGLSDPIAYELIWLRNVNADLLAALTHIEEIKRHYCTMCNGSVRACDEWTPGTCANYEARAAIAKAQP